jgi:hypothetical protein
MLQKMQTEVLFLDPDDVTPALAVFVEDGFEIQIVDLRARPFGSGLRSPPSSTRSTSSTGYGRSLILSTPPMSAKPVPSNKLPDTTAPSAMAAPSNKGVTAMYLVVFLDTQEGNYEFNVSLHSSLPKAEAAYEALLRRFVFNPVNARHVARMYGRTAPETLPPKAIWTSPNCDLYDHCGEEPHIYRIKCDEPAEEISVSDLAAA